MTTTPIAAGPLDVTVRAAIDSGLALKTYGVTVLDEAPTWQELYMFADTIRSDEREQCAKVCEMVEAKSRAANFRSAAYICAAEIRSRSNLNSTTP